MVNDTRNEPPAPARNDDVSSALLEDRVGRLERAIEKLSSDQENHFRTGMAAVAGLLLTGVGSAFGIAAWADGKFEGLLRDSNSIVVENTRLSTIQEEILRELADSKDSTASLVVEPDETLQMTDPEDGDDDAAIPATSPFTPQELEATATLEDEGWTPLDEDWAELEEDWANSVDLIQDRWRNLTEEEILRTGGSKEKLVDLIVGEYDAEFADVERELDMVAHDSVSQ